MDTAVVAGGCRQAESVTQLLPEPTSVQAATASDKVDQATKCTGSGAGCDPVVNDLCSLTKRNARHTTGDDAYAKFLVPFAEPSLPLAWCHRPWSSIDRNSSWVTPLHGLSLRIATLGCRVASLDWRVASLNARHCVCLKCPSSAWTQSHGTLHRTNPAKNLQHCRRKNPR